MPSLSLLSNKSIPLFAVIFSNKLNGKILHNSYRIYPAKNVQSTDLGWFVKNLHIFTKYQSVAAIWIENQQKRYNGSFHVGITRIYIGRKLEA